MAVAKNPGCPENLLRSLAKDVVKEVSVAVGENPSCPEDLLRLLAEDSYWSIRTAVAKNLKCPGELLRKLIMDEVFDVRCVAVARLYHKWIPETYSPAKHPFRLPEEFEPIFASPIDLNAAFSAIERCDKEDRLFLQTSLAANPTSPAKVLRRLTRCKNPIVWKFLAENPNADDELRSLVIRKILMNGTIA